MTHTEWLTLAVYGKTEKTKQFEENLENACKNLERNKNSVVTKRKHLLRQAAV